MACVILGSPAETDVYIYVASRSDELLLAVTISNALLGIIKKIGEVTIIIPNSRSLIAIRRPKSYFLKKLKRCFLCNFGLYGN